MCHLNEEEGRREQEAGSTWPPTHSPILHISNWERAGKYTYSIDYNKYNTSTRTFIHMHTLTIEVKIEVTWETHMGERTHWKYWIALHLAEKESSVELIWVLICPETFVSKYTDNQNQLDLLYPIPCRKYLKASVSFPGCKKGKTSWSELLNGGLCSTRTVKTMCFFYSELLAAEITKLSKFSLKLV